MLIVFDASPAARLGVAVVVAVGYVVWIHPVGIQPRVKIAASVADGPPDSDVGRPAPMLATLAQKRPAHTDVACGV